MTLNYTKKGGEPATKEEAVNGCGSAILNFGLRVLGLMLAWNVGVVGFIHAGGGSASNVSFWAALFVIIGVNVVRNTPIKES